MFQPVDVLSVVGLATALDELSTTQLILMKNSVVCITTTVIGAFFFLVDMDIYCPEWRVLCRTQKGVPSPTYEQYWDIFLVYLQNWMIQFLLTPFYALAEDFFGYTTAPPSWLEIPVDFFKYVIPLSVWVYAWHRLVHHPLLYGLLHKKHHKFKAPVAIEAFYFTAIDMFMGNIFPLIFCVMFAARSQWTMLLIYEYSVVTTLGAHCGYTMRFVSQGFHDAHHEFFCVNYSSGLKFMDHIFGTFLDPEGIKARRLKKQLDVNWDKLISEAKPRL